MNRLMTMGIAASLVTCVLGAAPARAQMETREGIALQNQIFRLQRDVDTLRQERGGASGGQASSLGRATGPAAGTAVSSDITTQLLERVDRLEDMIRQLNGRMDEAENARQRQNADLAKQIADLQFRLDNGGAAASQPAPAGRPSAPPTTSPPPVPLGTLPAGAAPSAPGKRTPELALQEGSAALARRDYVAAEAAAREVLATKGSPRQYDAQFLLAQAMTGQKNFPQAAVAYSDAFNRNKQGARAQDSLVGLAASLGAIGEKRAACEALASLHAQFPTPRQDIAQRAVALQASNGCR